MQFAIDPREIYMHLSYRGRTIRTFLLSAIQTFLLAAISLTPHLAHAQGINNGSISGTVADQTGAIIPGAKITATATATNIKAVTTAGGDGNFSFKDVPVGSYPIVISASGCSGLTLNNVQVAASR